MSFPNEGIETHSALQIGQCINNRPTMSFPDEEIETAVTVVKRLETRSLSDDELPRRGD